MKKNVFLISLAALVFAGCAKDPNLGTNYNNKLYFDSWIQMNHPTAVKTNLGAYIIEDIPGTGAQIEDAATSPFVRFDYIISDLKGNVLSTTSRPLAQKVFSDYDELDYYLPEIWYREEGSILVGIEESISAMRIGGRRTVAIPGWLNTTDVYSTAKQYEDNVTGEDAVYTLTAVEQISNIIEWETDSLCRYMKRNHPAVSVEDSLKYGFYYVRTKEPKTLDTLLKDTTIYIYYTGRLLNGQVFDTNVKDTAIRYGISVSTTDPVLINCRDPYTSTTMTDDESSIIDGFAYGISKMHPYEKGLSIFHSFYGYYSSGSGTMIPPYSPLIFEIELVDKPTE